MSCSCLPLKPGDHLIKEHDGITTHAIFCGQFTLGTLEERPPECTVKNVVATAKKNPGGKINETDSSGGNAQKCAETELAEVLLHHCSALEPFVVYVRRQSSAVLFVWKETLKDWYNGTSQGIEARTSQETGPAGATQTSDGQTSAETTGETTRNGINPDNRPSDSRPPFGSSEEVPASKFRNDFSPTARTRESMEVSLIEASKSKTRSSNLVRFYISRPFSRLRSVYTALKVLHDTPKISVHPHLVDEVMNSDIFVWHCLFQDFSVFNPGIGFSQMKAKRFRREPYQKPYLSAATVDGLQSGTVLVSNGVVVLRGAKLARFLRFSKAAVGSWAQLGAMLGAQLSEKIFVQDSPRGQSVAAAGSWIGSVAGASLGASLAAATSIGEATVTVHAAATAHFGTTVYAIAPAATGVAEGTALMSTIIVATGFGAAGAIVGAGTALALKNQLMTEDSSKADRTSAYLDREYNLFGEDNDEDNPFGTYAVTLEFDDVGDDILVTEELTPEEMRKNQSLVDLLGDEAKSPMKNLSSEESAHSEENTTSNRKSAGENAVPSSNTISPPTDTSILPPTEVGADNPVRDEIIPPVKAAVFKKPRFIARGWYTVPIAPEEAQT